MRTVIIALVVIVVGFTAVVVWGMARDREGESGSSSAQTGGPPPMRDGEVDEDRLEDWEPPAIGEALNAVLAPFAPKLKLDRPQVSVAGTGTDQRAVPPSDDDIRVARVTLIAGDVIRVTNVCVPGKDRKCPQTTCLCRPGANLARDEVRGRCGNDWLRRRSGGCRAGEDDRVGLVVYREGGTLEFGGTGTSATAEVR